MSKQLDEIELRLRMILTKERSQVRGRHSRKATQELNNTLPDIERRFYAEVQAGRLPDLMDFFPVGSGE